LKTYTYDGDTPPAVRAAIRSAGQVVITNPDMLHTGILPHHTKWVKLFENLRYVVLDELHTYRGVFGSNVANVLRRLRRVCAFYGAHPIFICTSATIANPEELARRHVEDDVVLIDRNGAPRGEKVLAFVNPPVVNQSLGVRKSALFTGRDIAATLLASGVQTIAFTRSRVSTELLLTYLRARFPAPQWPPDLVRGYRSGYLPSERRAIERGLRDGSVRGVVPPNALELGIDIGALQAAVRIGYPGTVASTWQQRGRAGRRERLAAAVLAAAPSPVDPYADQHPDPVLHRPPDDGHAQPAHLHDPEHCQVERLEWENAKAYVREVKVEYYTQAGESVRIRVLDEFAEQGAPDFAGGHGEVLVSAIATIYKKLTMFTHENIGWGKIHIPEQELQTTSFWLSLPEPAVAGWPKERVEIALAGLGNLLHGLAPLLLMCAPHDLGLAVEVRSPHTERPTIFLFDMTPGGVGFSERLFRSTDALLERAREHLASCGCGTGCPSCVGPAHALGPDVRDAVADLLSR